MFGRFIDRPSTININSDLVFFDISKLDDFPELAPVGFVLLATLIKERVTINPGRRKNRLVRRDVGAPQTQKRGRHA